MTTHYEKIQALGNRMASNLEPMGVSASFSDGGLTLADKILEIQHQTKGIVVSVDKWIEQKSGTSTPNEITISSFIMQDDGTFIPDGTRVFLDGLPYLPSWELESETLVWGTAQLLGSEGWSLTSTTPESVVYIGSSGSSYFTFYKTSTGWNISYKDNATPTSITGNKILYVGQGIVTNGTGDFVDLATVSGSSSSIVSSWYPDRLLGYIGNSELFDLMQDTASSGIAVFDYDCTGAGKFTFRVYCGSLVSEPYSLWDTIYHNEEITSTISLDVSTNSNSIGLEFDAYMGANNSQTWFSLGTDNNNRILVGVIYGSSQQGIVVRSNGSNVNSVYASTRAPVGETSHIKFTYDNGVMTYSDGDETITLTDNTISPSKLLGGTVMQDGSVSNLKLYKI